MEYEIRDVVIVKGIRGGFYGVIAGRHIIATGHVEYDVAPLDGRSVWRVTATRVHPSDRGFPAKHVDDVLNNFAIERRLPVALALGNALVKTLATLGIAPIGGGFTIAFEPAKLAAAGPVHFDRALGLYWGQKTT